MKCKICRYTTRSLPNMAAHYRKKHPQKMKVHKRARKSTGHDSEEISLLKKILAKL